MVAPLTFCMFSFVYLILFFSTTKNALFILKNVLIYKISIKNGSDIRFRLNGVDLDQNCMQKSSC